MSSADIDADDSNCAAKILRHGVLLIVGAPGQLRSLVGQEHGQATPFSTVRGVTIVQRSKAATGAPRICYDHPTR